MLYCVKCGDPIEKDELICDKCGYHFTIVEGSPAKVYMNQVPGKGMVPPQVAGSGRQGVQQHPGQSNVQGMQQRTVQSGGQSVQIRPMQPYGPGMQTRPTQPYGPGMQTRATQPYGQGVQGSPVQNQRKQSTGRQSSMRGVTPAKPKKKKRGWLIALGAITGGLAVVCLCVVVGISLFWAAGNILLGQEDDIIVNNSTDDTDVNAPDTSPVIHDNSDTVVMADDGYLEDAIRDPFVTLKGNNEDTVTVMIYMNGSNLESNSGMATEDIREILSATLSENVNVVIQTGGTRRWKTKAIASDHSQRFIVENGALTLVDDSLDQLDITDPQTLEDFIVFCDTYYPADRNMLIMWNHGGGAVYGFGYDEHVDDYEATLSLDEMQMAIRNSGVKFEMIGFDACLMGGLETACAFYDTADYLIASEDFESGRGWEYQNWLTILGTNSSTPMEDLAKVIIDDFVKESQAYGFEGILALIDLRYTRLLFQSWIDFAYSAQADLLACNYSMEMSRTGRAMIMFESPVQRFMRDPLDALFDTDDYDMEEYNYAVDLMALADTLSTEEAKALKSALGNALVYCSATSGDAEMTGLSVTLPYNSEEFYEDMEEVYTNCGFDTEYIDFLESFVDAQVESYDWGESDWSGWEEYEEEEYDWEDWDQWEEYQENDFGWDEYEYDWEDWY